jgi:hypothetical protein
VDANDAFTLPLTDDFYGNYEWAGPLKPPT